jgi:hypothetical protein
VLKHALNQRRVKNMMMQTSVFKVFPAARTESHRSTDAHPEADFPARFIRTLQQVGRLVIVDNGSSEEEVL